MIAPDVLGTMGGVMRLQGGAFMHAAGIATAPLVAPAIVVAAGLSDAFGQSIVLFANRVKPARFAFSLLINALLFTFGYAFLVLSTWAVTRLPGTAHMTLRDVAVVFAISYAPMLFSFLSALPYLGAGLLRVLRVWHFLATVVGISAVGRVDVFVAATYVWLGWLLFVIAQHSFGKPIAAAGARMLDAVAGVRVVSDADAIVGRTQPGSRPDGKPAVLAAHSTPATRAAPWTAIAGLCGMAVLAVIVALALEPVRSGVFGWQSHLPQVLRLPIDLLWVGVIAGVVAMLMAPFETLGWWAGWYGDEIDTSDEARPPQPAADAAAVSRYVVYLDGISQSSSRYTSDIETFLDALAPELPANVRLVRGVMCYSVVNKPLEDDPILSRFWKFVDVRRSTHLNSLVGLLVNLRNVTIVAVSADPRYGPMYNFGIADVIYRALLAAGYAKRSGVPVTLIGYSGGGQMACGAAGFLKRALDAPLDVISLGGVISGNDPILRLEHLYHLVGDKDYVERIGPLMFASRWPFLVWSYWNRAKRLGVLTCVPLGPVAHQVPGGMLDPAARLPDGRTFLRQTLDDIGAILTDRLTSAPAPAKKPTNYARYAAGQQTYPTPPADGALRAGYVPVAPWIGRLALPHRDERFGGVWFDVLHAPAQRAGLTGTRVRLVFSGDEHVAQRLRAVVRDLSFSAEARWAAEYGGMVLPERLNRWRLVNPLESLAGAHPNDDVFVKLTGEVTVHGDGAETTIAIEREPVQITGTHRALVTFLGSAPDGGDAFRVRHYDRAARAFSGEEERVRLPPVVDDMEGRPNSVSDGIERSPLNADGWHAYGTFDREGVFVVQSLAPRAPLRPNGAEHHLNDAHEAYRFARHQAWPQLVRHPGDIVSASIRPWSAGERGLLVHTYGGIGGPHAEAAARGPFYFGHFAYGVAEAIDDPLSGELHFEITYHQIYTSNADGLIAGALDWSRYMGDRQFGWAGVRPVCDAIVRHDALTQRFSLDGRAGRSALDALELQLEAMAARYRIGDGTGATFVGAANNCAQDSNRALFATLRALRRYVRMHPEFERWSQESPTEYARYRELLALTDALRKQLQPFGAPRRDWSHNQYNLGTTMEDAPVANLISALGSWRCILPRLAFDTILGTLARFDASIDVLGTNAIGGERHDVSAVAPTAL